MPYTTNEQKEWARWCDLSFAVHQICVADSCDQASAVQQLRLAIADGNVRLSWADKPLRYVDEPIFDSATPPTNAWWWLHHTEIDLEGTSPEENCPDRKGLVRDDWCLAPTYLGEISPAEKWSAWSWIEESQTARLEFVLHHRIRFRPLLLWQPTLNDIWSWPWPALKSLGDKPANLPLKRSAPDSEIINVFRELYAQHRDDPPNLNKAYELVRKKLPNTSRSKIRQILMTPEFSALRRRAGIRRMAPDQAR